MKKPTNNKEISLKSILESKSDYMLSALILSYRTGEPIISCFPTTSSESQSGLDTNCGPVYFDINDPSNVSELYLSKGIGSIYISKNTWKATKKIKNKRLLSSSSNNLFRAYSIVFLLLISLDKSNELFFSEVLE